MRRTDLRKQTHDGFWTLNPTVADLVAALTPDYEAAARTFAIQAGWTWHDVVNNDPGPRAAEAVRAVVDAALGVHPQDEGDEK